MVRMKVTLVILIVVIISLLGLLFYGRNRTTTPNTVSLIVTSPPSITSQSATLTPIATSPTKRIPILTKVTKNPSHVSPTL